MLSLFKSEVPLTQLWPGLPASSPTVSQLVFCAGASMKVAILNCKPARVIHRSLYVTGSWSHKERISKCVACQPRILTLFSMCISYFFLSHTHFWCSHNTFPLCNVSCCCFFQQCPLSSHLDSIAGVQLRAWPCAKGGA